MMDAHVAQMGKNFQTRVSKVVSPPVVTYAGCKLHTPEKTNLQEGETFFKFLLDCQKDYSARNILKTSFILEENEIRKSFDNLPKTNLMRYFWYVTNFEIKQPLKNIIG